MSKPDWFEYSEKHPPINRNTVIRPKKVSSANKTKHRVELECIGQRTICLPWLESLEDMEAQYDEFLGLPNKKVELPGTTVITEVRPKKKTAPPKLTPKAISGAKFTEKPTKKPHPLSKCKGCGKRNHSCECR